MFTKFTDLVRWLVNWAQNTLPGIQASITNASTNVIVSVEQAKQAAVDSANSAAQSHISAEEAKRVIITAATVDNLGVVKLASEDDVVSGAASKVVLASQLRKLKNDVDAKTKHATLTEHGIVKLGSPSDITNLTDNVVMTPSLLKYYQVKPDLSGLVTLNRTLEGLVFSLIQVDDKAIIHMSGQFTGASATIRFPITVHQTTVGVAGTIKDDAALSIVTSSITDEEVVLVIKNTAGATVSGDASFVITAEVNTAGLPLPPRRLTSYAEGNTVVLAWEA